MRLHLGPVRCPIAEGDAVRAIVASVSVVMLVVVQPLAAQKRVSAVTGTHDDLRTFEEQISRCQRVVGDPFRLLVSRFKLQSVPLHVLQRAPPTAYSFAAFATSTRPHELYLDRLLSMPQESRDGPKVISPSDVPSWATTQCVVLAHELAEATFAHVVSREFCRSHEHAIGMENLVRKALGQKQCREKQTAGNEQTDVPHTDHSDFVLRIGHHTERYHRKGNPVSVTVTYEIGSDRRCSLESNYDAELQ
jgi:hypothetical protein